MKLMTKATRIQKKGIAIGRAKLRVHPKVPILFFTTKLKACLSHAFELLGGG
jgi:hypothetical protein